MYITTAGETRAEDRMYDLNTLKRLNAEAAEKETRSKRPASFNRHIVNRPWSESEPWPADGPRVPSDNVEPGKRPAPHGDPLTPRECSGEKDPTDGTYIAMVGNLTEGFFAYGPYPDFETAAAKHEGPDVWIMGVLLKPLTEKERAALRDDVSGGAENV